MIAAFQPSTVSPPQTHFSPARRLIFSVWKHIFHTGASVPSIQSFSVQLNLSQTKHGNPARSPGLKVKLLLGLHVKSHDQLKGAKGIRLTYDVPRNMAMNNFMILLTLASFSKQRNSYYGDSSLQNSGPKRQGRWTKMSQVISTDCAPIHFNAISLRFCQVPCIFPFYMAGTSLSLGDVRCSWDVAATLRITPQQTNISPENCWLED